MSDVLATEGFFDPDGFDCCGFQTSPQCPSTRF